jgi:hypothetical protein
MEMDKFIYVYAFSIFKNSNKYTKVGGRGVEVEVRMGPTNIFFKPGVMGLPRIFDENLC